MAVFVLDKRKRPLMPCSEKRARLLLGRGQLRYRAPRFDNRTRPAGGLPPSLRHRVDTTRAWVDRLCRLAPVTALDMQTPLGVIQGFPTATAAGCNEPMAMAMPFNQN